MITELRLTNFKAFRNEQRIPLSRLNLIYGQNSSGKSSIIQALLFLYAVTQRPGGAAVAPSSGIRFRLLGQDLELPSVALLRHRHSRWPVAIGYSVLPEKSETATAVDFRWGAGNNVSLSKGGFEIAHFFHDDKHSQRNLDRGPLRVMGRVQIPAASPLVEMSCEGAMKRIEKWLSSKPGRRSASRLFPDGPAQSIRHALGQPLSVFSKLLVSRSCDHLFDLTDLPPWYAGKQSGSGS